MTANNTEHKCPYCNTNGLETTATAPYVRGMILAYQMGSKTFIGCVPCVRKKTLGEAGLSSLIGWFSITSLIINPFLITYNLIQGLATSAKPEKVKAKLAEMGVPMNSADVDLNEIGYILGSLMIKADGKVEAEEIDVAEKIGEKIFPDFDEARFRMIIKSDQKLPPLNEVAPILNNVMDEEGKHMVIRYLIAIAKSDGHVDAAEKQMISEMATLMKVDLHKLASENS